MGIRRTQLFLSGFLLLLLAAGCSSGPPSVPGMVYVKKGTYTLGSEKHSAEDGEEKSYSLQQSFHIDKYEVTNEEYKKFVDEAGHEPPSHWEEGTFAEGREKHPVVNVTYADAEAYAEWAGKRLPTEEEWECAARGFPGYLYPWGNEYEKGKANDANSGVGDTVPVGEYKDGRSPTGAYDMAGNVWEWTASWLTDAKKKRVLRGSSYNLFDPDPRLSKRAGRSPDKANMYTGFRCAKGGGGTSEKKAESKEEKESSEEEKKEKDDEGGVTDEAKKKAEEEAKNKAKSGAEEMIPKTE